MTVVVPSLSASPRQPTWRAALSWLLPVVLLAAAFAIGLRTGRRGSEPRPENPLTQPHEPGLLPGGGLS